MNRRTALVVAAGTAGGAVLTGRAAGAEPAVPGAFPFKPGREVRIGVQSAPVKADGDDLHIISIGVGTFTLTGESRLTAKLKAAVVQYADVEYRISAAVFDEKGRLLGTADHTEQVQYIRTGYTPTFFRDIAFDFGISKAYGRAALAAVAVSERDVPKPG